MPGHSVLRFSARYSATDLNKSGGKLLDSALEGAVEIKRRKQSFVLMRQDQLLRLLEEARDDRPKSLEDLLHGYDADKINKLARGFLDDEPSGKELI
jgi:hypothetical protein